MIQRFKFEQEMIPSIISAGPELIEKNDEYVVFLECIGSPGIADVVFVDFNIEVIEKRTKVGLGPIIKAIDIYTLFTLDTICPKTLKEISREIHYSLNYVRNALCSLCEKGFVYRDKKGYIKTNLYGTVLKNIVAIEAKRENWTKGILQARRYQRFANRVFLALDNAYSNRVIKHLNSLSKQQIGIITVSANDNSVKVHSIPDWDKPFSEVEHALIGERLWHIIDAHSNDNNSGFGTLIKENNEACYLSRFSQISK